MIILIHHVTWWNGVKPLSQRRSEGVATAATPRTKFYKFHLAECSKTTLTEGVTSAATLRTNFVRRVATVATPSECLFECSFTAFPYKTRQTTMDTPCGSARTQNQGY